MRSLTIQSHHRVSKKKKIGSYEVIYALFPSYLSLLTKDISPQPPPTDSKTDNCLVSLAEKVGGFIGLC